jgi:SRSO17 transposase
MAMREEAAAWAEELERLGARIGPRRRALAYLRGLLAPVERKNGWQLAQAAGDPTPDGMQDFLARMRWDADAVRDDLRAYVVEQLGDPGAVLVSGRDRVCEERGEVGGRAAAVQRHGGADRELPDRGVPGLCEPAWAGADRPCVVPPGELGGRCGAAARVPAAVAFASQPGLGRMMLARAFRADVPCAWVTGDSVYGADPSLRRAVECERRGYVLAVTSAQRLGFKPVADWLEDMPVRAWKRLSAGDGAKGPRLYDWAWLPYRSDTAPGWKKGLLVRRQIARPGEFAFYLTLSPEPTSLADLVRVAGTRWTIEACFEQAKGETGLDQYEVRSWTGWHRHITFAMLAHAYLAVLRRAVVGGRDDPRPRGRAAPAHRAGDPPPARVPGLGASP